MNDEEWTNEMLHLIKLLDMLEGTFEGKTREYVKRKIDESIQTICSDGKTDITGIKEYLAMLGIVLADTSPRRVQVQRIPLP